MGVGRPAGAVGADGMLGVLGMEGVLAIEGMDGLKPPPDIGEAGALIGGMAGVLLAGAW